VIHKSMSLKYEPASVTTTQRFSEQKKLASEIEIMKRVKHPNCIQFFESNPPPNFLGIQPRVG